MGPILRVRFEVLCKICWWSCPICIKVKPFVGEMAESSFWFVVVQSTLQLLFVTSHCGSFDLVFIHFIEHSAFNIWDEAKRLGRYWAPRCICFHKVQKFMCHLYVVDTFIAARTKIYMTWKMHVAVNSDRCKHLYCRCSCIASVFYKLWGRVLPTWENAVKIGSISMIFLASILRMQTNENCKPWM